MNTNLNAEAILDGSISQSKLDADLNTLLNETLATKDDIPSFEAVATVEDYGQEVVMPVSNIVSMSQEEYDALTEKNPNTIYLIV